MLTLTAAALFALAAGAADDPPVCLPRTTMLRLFTAGFGHAPFVASPPGPADGDGVRIQELTRRSANGADMTLHIYLHPHDIACLGPGKPRPWPKATSGPPRVCMARATFENGIAALHMRSMLPSAMQSEVPSTEPFYRPAPDQPGRVEVIMVDHYRDGRTCLHVPLEWAGYFKP